jgi:hypothetical protein
VVLNIVLNSLVESLSVGQFLFQKIKWGTKGGGGGGGGRVHR